MKLKYVLPTHFLRKDIEDIEINGLTEDSRYAKRGDLFFIKERHNFDIFSALGDVDAKVEAFIAQNKFKSKIRNLGLAKPVIFVNNIHLAFRYAADKFYNFNKHDFIFIGVTGTK
jgi:UDP-N-acetylmuramoyl-L-alanyl-D-glutamate--2,6-diaminopimelate ligase